MSTASIAVPEAFRFIFWAIATTVFIRTHLALLAVSDFFTAEGSRCAVW
ncbi:MAG TPA: hypothetical protein VFB24_14465 [Candidatus Binatia bacterium]|nr:hypothetical protein [Candidatus Binatia bacterium]